MLRMREIGARALQKARTKREKKDCKKYYSEAAMRTRVRLLAHPEVVRALQMIWEATDTDGSGSIDREEYLVMHRKLVLALDPTVFERARTQARVHERA